MTMLRTLRYGGRKKAIRFALVGLLAVVLAVDWLAVGRPPSPESAPGALLAQSSPISPLQAVTSLTAEQSAVRPGSLLLTRSRLALPCVTSILLLMLTATGIAFWRQSS
jgi:hypothetical protein